MGFFHRQRGFLNEFQKRKLGKKNQSTHVLHYFSPPSKSWSSGCQDYMKMGRKGWFWSSCYIVTLCLSQLLCLISAAFPSFREARALCAWEYLSVAYLKINKQEKWVITSEITRLDLSTVRGRCCYVRNARKTCSKWMKKSGAVLLCRALDFCLFFYDIFWRSSRTYWAF